jgi:hypothetical protein
MAVKLSAAKDILKKFLYTICDGVVPLASGLPESTQQMQGQANSMSLKQTLTIQLFHQNGLGMKPT